jgi:hypothetical protein
MREKAEAYFKLAKRVQHMGFSLRQIAKKQRHAVSIMEAGMNFYRGSQTSLAVTQQQLDELIPQVSDITDVTGFTGVPGVPGVPGVADMN